MRPEVMLTVQRWCEMFHTDVCHNLSCRPCSLHQNLIRCLSVISPYSGLEPEPEVEVDKCMCSPPAKCLGVRGHASPGKFFKLGALELLLRPCLGQKLLQVQITSGVT